METIERLWNRGNEYAEAVFFHPIFKKGISIFAYIVMPVVVIGSIFGNLPYALHVQAGSLAQILLLIILFMKPLGIVFRIRILKRLLVYRRQMGVATFYLALIHFFGLVQPERIFDAQYYVLSNNVFYGAIALIILGLLWVTSNNRALHILRRNWKRLHYLAYPALLLVLLHASLASGELQKIFVLGSAFIILKVMERKHVTVDIPIISTP